MLKDLSDAQIRIATESLVDDGKLRAVDVYNALRAVRAKAQRIIAATGGPEPKLRHIPIQRLIAAEARKAAAPRTTAAQRASRKLQGQYLNLMRQIPEAERDGFRKTAGERGRAAAIAAMRKQLRGVKRGK